MSKKSTTLIIFLTAAAVMMFSIPASAETVQCEQCTEEYPCATMFEFKNLKFMHNVYCRFDEEGREYWNSKDEEKYDMFFFEGPNHTIEQKKVEI
jgi:hypothetical protein